MKKQIITLGLVVALGGIASPAFADEAPVDACVSTASYSHTYDATTNSGVITATGDFCAGDALYISSTAWDYATNAVWPQALSNVSYLTIAADGEYPYGQVVACGQGDIYASKTAYVVPTATLSGPSVEFSETFLHELSSGASPTYVQQDVACWVEPSPTPTPTPTEPPVVTPPVVTPPVVTPPVGNTPLLAETGINETQVWTFVGVAGLLGLAGLLFTLWAARIRRGI